MKNFFTLTLCFLTLSLTAQIDNFPFNPDSNSDGFISVDDLMAMLSNFGEPFELPDYTEWSIGTMNNLLEYNESLNLLSDSLSALQSQLSYVQNNMESYLDSAISAEVSAQTSLLLERQIYNAFGGGNWFTFEYVQPDAVFIRKTLGNCGTSEYACIIRFPTEGFTVGQKVFIQYFGDDRMNGQCNSCGLRVNMEQLVNDTWTTFAYVQGTEYQAYQWPVVREFTFNGESWSAASVNFDSLPTSN